MGAALFVSGLVCGLVFTGGWIMALIRVRMINVVKSPMPFGETVQALQGSIRKAGWILPGSRRLNESLEKAEVHFPRKVQLIELCEPHHAAEVLAEDRRMACLMPCIFAVYEGDDGAVYVSMVNTRLMGKVFGGSVAVAKTKNAIVSSALGRPWGHP